MACSTCIKLRKAAYAAIRTVVRVKQSAKDVKNINDTNGVSKKSPAPP